MMDIREDKNILKFSFYGFFKNLKFFEPFLYLFFLKQGFSYLQIGTLISLREIIKNVFEVPSGVMADNYGRIKTLKICFVSYIISFVLFYLGGSYPMVALAVVFFGLGEAFRSGTHKAIIFAYIDRNSLQDRRVEIYGLTRSYSLIGSSLSAIIGGLIVFIESDYRLIFLLSVLPYLIDFILVNSYPRCLDGPSGKRLSFSLLLASARRSITNLREVANLRRGMLNSSIYEGYFKTLKDYLQPVLRVQIIGLVFMNYFANREQGLAVLLGISYFFINLLSAYISRNAFKVEGFFNNWEQLLNSIFFFSTLAFGLVGFLVLQDWIIPVMIAYLLLYALRSLRRPVMLDYLSRVIAREERATMLSVESQLTTLITIVLAPLLGIVADRLGLWALFVTAFLSLTLFYFLTAVAVNQEGEG